MRDRADAANAVILLGAALAAAALLWTAAHGPIPLVRVAAAILFSFVANTLFALLHESVHGNFNRNARLNAVGGRIAAAFFPTSFTLQRAFHLTHHRNNRSPIERFDCIGPTENVELKTAQWFTILTGIYWVSAPLFSMVFALFGGVIPWKRIAAVDTEFSRQTSASAFLGSIQDAPLARVRLDMVLALAVQGGLFLALDLTPASWLLCYGAFALNWSSLQYADHAFTPFDRLGGAWNLRVDPVTRLFFLNYHDHLAHHGDTSRRWQSLPGHVSPGEASVPFLRVLYRMWQGPYLLDEAQAPPARRTRRDRAVVVAHTLVFGALFLLVYGGASNDYADIARPFQVGLPADAAIPFMPGFGLVYVSMEILLVLVPVVLAKPAKTLPFLVALVFELVFAWFCYQLYPVALPPVQAVDATGFGGMMYRAADISNLNGNGLPSLHVAFALSCAWVLSPLVSTWLRPALWLWAIAICASTLLVKQHYLIDVVTGALLAGFTMTVIYPRLVRARSAGEAGFVLPTERYA